MRRGFIGWSVIAALACGVGGWLIVRQQAIAALETNVRVRRAGLARQVEQARQNAELRAALANAAPSASADATQRLRDEIAALERRLNEPSAVAAAPIPRALPASPPMRFGVGSTIPASDWKNAGMLTAGSTLESALWAGAGGDVDALSSMLYLDSRAKTAAQALLASLPPAEQGRYGTPERLLAALTIPEMPTGSVEVREWGGIDPSAPVRTQWVSIMLSTADGRSRPTQLILIDSNSTWQLLVTPEAVARLAGRLRMAPAKGGD